MAVLESPVSCSGFSALPEPNLDASSELKDESTSMMLFLCTEDRVTGLET